MRITQDLMKGLQMLAGRVKRVEIRLDGIEEMLKVVRELLERGLRPLKGLPPSLVQLR